MKRAAPFILVVAIAAAVPAGAAADGSRYEGEWRNGERHGRGTLIDADGTRWPIRTGVIQRASRGRYCPRQAETPYHQGE